MKAKAVSVLTKKQVKTYRAEYTEDGKPHVIIAHVRHDDQCGNGHNTFAITGEIYGPRGCRQDGKQYTADGKAVYMESCGCVHDAIAKHIPALATFIKWHLVDTDQPSHYVANVVYLAGDRDCWGMKKGEFRQHTSRGQQNGGKAGVKNWILEIPESQARDVYADECPPPVVCHWKPYGRTGEGKERELDAARRAAIWPDATDAELSQEPEQLTAALLARLPALMEEFQAAVESLGFIY